MLEVTVMRRRFVCGNVILLILEEAAKGRRGDKKNKIKTVSKRQKRL